MKTMPWFRFYSETADDIKFSFLSRQLNIPKYAVIGIWSVLECRANQSPVRGALYVTVLKRYSNNDIADELGVDLEFCNKIIQAFIEMEMLEVRDGAIYLKNWDKRQYTSDNSNERVQKHREKQLCNVTVTPEERSSSASASASVSESVIFNSDSLIKEEDENFEKSDDPFEIMQNLVSQLTGCPMTGQKDAMAITAFVDNGVMQSDIQDALAFFKDKGIKVFSVSQIQKSVLQAVKTRTQNSNASRPKVTSTITDLEALANEMRL